MVVAGATVLPNPNPPVLAGSTVLLAGAPNEKEEAAGAAFELAVVAATGFEPAPPAPKANMPPGLAAAGASFLAPLIAPPNVNTSVLGAEASTFLVSVLATAAPKSNEGGAFEAWVVTVDGAKLNVEDAVVLITLLPSDVFVVEAAPKVKADVVPVDAAGATVG